jgi:large subunit ribosomal protein L18
MQAQINRKAIRLRVRHRIRKKISGTAERPRLAVFRSPNHMYAQVIDDLQGKTLAHASTRQPAIRSECPKGGNTEAAKKVGQAIAEQLKAAGVETVVFDRGGFVYHGRVKALADAVREVGIKL